MKDRAYKLLVVILFLTLLFFFAFFTVELLNEHHVKHAKDYSTSDFVQAKKVVLGLLEPTNEMFEKYDVDEDGLITNLDTNIIKQMILRYYDVYVISNNVVYVIKFEYKGETNESKTNFNGNQ